MIKIISKTGQSKTIKFIKVIDCSNKKVLYSTWCFIENYYNWIVYLKSKYID